MGVVIPAGFGQIAFRFLNDASPVSMYSTLGVSAAVLNTGMLEDVCDAFTDGPVSDMASNYTFAGAVLKVGPTSTGPTFEVVRSTAGGGSVGGPANSAFVVRKITTKGGRSGKGRMFMPGVADTQVDSGGRLGPDEPGDMQTQFDEFFTALGALDVTPVLLHSDVSDPDDIVSFSVQPVIGTQRRRIHRL